MLLGRFVISFEFSL